MNDDAKITMSIFDALIGNRPFDKDKINIGNYDPLNNHFELEKDGVMYQVMVTAVYKGEPYHG